MESYQNVTSVAIALAIAIFVALPANAAAVDGATDALNQSASEDRSGADGDWRKVPPPSQDNLAEEFLGQGANVQPKPHFMLSAPRAVAPIPIQLNQMARGYVEDFLAAPDSIQGSFNRSRPFFSQMVRTLRSYGLPDDLVYLSFAESAFSRQNRGVWQFTSATARRFGLKIDRYVDERRDPIAATRAAAEYLATLHDAAGSDWKVAMVGWNNGDLAIECYWSLRGANFDRMMNRLPKQTRTLLGRFMAVAYIAHHAESYGLTPATIDSVPGFREISVHGGLQLNVVAAEYGTSVAAIHELNPALLREMTPPYARMFSLRIPSSARADASDSVRIARELLF
jgi:membrane-bound lytic murein transglycosylase D